MTGKNVPAGKPLPRAKTPPEKRPQTTDRASQWIGAGLKAGLVGGLGLIFLQLVNLIQIPLLLCLELPGYILLLLMTGALAGLFGSRYIGTAGQAVRVGALSGFVTGIIGGMLGMILAGFGLTLRSLGYGVVTQFSSSQLEGLAKSGVTPDVIQVAGSVFFALLIWGLGGTLLSMLLSAAGGRLYYRLR